MSMKAIAFDLSRKEISHFSEISPSKPFSIPDEENNRSTPPSAPPPHIPYSSTHER